MRLLLLVLLMVIVLLRHCPGDLCQYVLSTLDVSFAEHAGVEISGV